MATYTVQPLDDGVDQRGNWEVVKNYGQRVSTHVKKSAAKRTARQKAGPNDTVRIKNTSGRYIG